MIKIINTSLSQKVLCDSWYSLLSTPPQLFKKDFIYPFDRGRVQAGGVAGRGKGRSRLDAEQTV